MNGVSFGYFGINNLTMTYIIETPKIDKPVTNRNAYGRMVTVLPGLAAECASVQLWIVCHWHNTMILITKNHKPIENKKADISNVLILFKYFINIRRVYNIFILHS